MNRWIFPLEQDSQSDDDDVNLTPLIDVVFVVLIMFILVAPLVDLDRIQLAPAAAAKKPDMVSLQQNAPIKIHVYADNTIWINGSPIELENLTKLLKQAHQVSPYTSPQLYHDKSAYFGTYQSVKNAVESAGFESLDVILKSS
ncbi:MAG: ExbD/TolR family protein [Simkaniaceae bacterium]|jgi:biopolymer transport protein ExbD